MRRLRCGGLGREGRCGLGVRLKRKSISFDERTREWSYLGRLGSRLSPGGLRGELLGLRRLKPARHHLLCLVDRLSGLLTELLADLGGLGRSTRPGGRKVRSGDFVSGQRSSGNHLR